ncbi:MAG: SusC/RagA family TonB-linked outer membrane protein [Mangrovibacterium sp.]|nr:SusC/RagA family TonB-linked outer membrane protein [Mangrovibacterium sp.]
MKKMNAYHGKFKLPDVKKMIRVMKITAFFLLIALVQVSAETYSQAAKLNLNYRNVKLSELLDNIEKSSDYRFFYDSRAVDLSGTVSVNSQDSNLKEVLDQILGTDLTYEMVNSNIVVIKNAKVGIGEVSVPQQQSLNVSGRVTDASGSPLPGVTLIIKGTGHGTVTNTNGEYSVSNVPADGVLSFSFVGMKTQEVAIAGKNQINVTMAEETVGIDEVVAIGYGTKKKRDVIGSVASVKGDELVQTPTSSFTDILQGRAAGVQVATTSGSPGATVDVKVRGYHSINSGSNPLWVIDGMPVFGNGEVGLNDGTSAGQNILATMNPNDIESIEVLKDAAATAIYGSRGSNGVIIVTTKSGKINEKGSIQVDYSTGISHLTKSIDKFDFVNTTEWFEIADMSLAHTNVPNRTFDVDYALPASRFPTRLTREEAEATNTNWFDYVLRTGSYQDVNVAFKQGFQKGSIYSSISYRNDKSVSVGNDMDRLSSRINASFSPIENLEWTTRLNFSYTNNYRVKSESHRTLGESDGTIGGFGEVTRSGLPWLPVYDEDDPTGYWNPGAGNFALASDRNYILDQKKNYRGLGGSSLEYHLPWVKGLSIRTGADYDIIQDNSDNWSSSLISNDGVSYARASRYTYISYNYNAYLKYNKTFGEKHSISAVLGTESQKSKVNISDMQGRNLVGSNEEMGSSSPANMSSMISYTGNERYLRSYFIRADYKFMDKYLIGLSARRDGSSVFDADFRWGNFYALSAGWILSDEDFFSGLKNTFSLLKLRGSFGQTGNEAIPNDKNLIAINYDSNLRYGVNSYSPAGVSYSVGNKSITWETTDSYDAGVDFGLFNNKVSGSLAYYMQNVSGLLLAVSTPPSAAIGSIYGNVGRIKNWGYEFNVSSVNIQEKNFSWSTDFNISYNKNKIVELTSDMEAAKGSTKFVGGRLGLWQKCDYAGIDPERGVHMIWEYDKNTYESTGKYVRTGRKIPYTDSNARLSHNQLVHSDKSIIPTFYGGLGNTLRYKGFELTAFFTFSGGNYMYNYSEKEWTIFGIGNKIFKRDMLTQSWKPEWTDEQKQHAKYPLIVYESGSPYYTKWDANAIDPNTGREGYWVNPDINNPVSPQASEKYEPANRGTADSEEGLTKYLEKADYLRLKTLSFGYNLPRSFAKKIGLQSGKIFVSGTNIWTLTGYSGFDPETDDDSEFLPSVKMFSIGANLTF